MKKTAMAKINFAGMKALVLGDMMLDSYQWGKVQRISPEAPVPIIEINHEEYRLGGAANAAMNLASLGAKVVPIGIIGNDANGDRLLQMLVQNDILNSGIVRDYNRKTTIKTRIGAANQQIVRIDIEDTHYITPAVMQAVLRVFADHLSDCDVVIIEDYNKGLLCAELISEVLSLCKHHKVPVTVDPKHKNFSCYQGVDIFKPNYSELQTYLGQNFDDEASFVSAAEKLRRKMKVKHLVVTRSAKGMYIFSAGGKSQHLPSFAREVWDVSGAGDTVIATLSLAYAKKMNILDAATVANHAAGVACGKMGTSTVKLDEIMDSINAPR